MGLSDQQTAILGGLADAVAKCPDIDLTALLGQLNTLGTASVAKAVATAIAAGNLSKAQADQKRAISQAEKSRGEMTTMLGKAADAVTEAQAELDKAAAADVADLTLRVAATPAQ